MGLLDHLSGIVDLRRRIFEMGTAVHGASMFQWHSGLGSRVQQASGRGSEKESQRDARVHKQLSLCLALVLHRLIGTLAWKHSRGWH